MKTRLLSLLFIVIMVLTATSGQGDENDEALTLPPFSMMSGFTYQHQHGGWNRCGPAVMTTSLSYFGYSDDIFRAINGLKPGGELDPNVSPWQMSEFVNTQVPELPVYSIYRSGGTLELLKTLSYNNFPVIIELGFEPSNLDAGWMGHYLLMIGYDDEKSEFIVHDTYEGPNWVYSYDHIEENWKHFNYTYIVLYDFDRQAELLEILGDDPNASEETNRYNNLINTLAIAQEDARANNNDAFAWHNLGTTLTDIAGILGEDLYYQQAAQAFDQARNLGLPYRIAWYQFDMYEAYLAVGRYDDVLAIAGELVNCNCNGQYVEETYYYAGRAREGMGDIERAITNYNTSLEYNPNFELAREHRDALVGG